MDQFAAFLPERPAADPSYPLGCHHRPISDRIVFDELLQLLLFGSTTASFLSESAGPRGLRG